MNQLTPEFEADSLITLGIIENQKLARIGIKTILNGARIQIVGEAGTGQAGLEMVKEQAPAVVIIDLGLPDMDGIELIKQLKASRPEMKIIVLTVYDNESFIIEALLAGTNAYCLKEQLSERLAEIIQTIHEGDCWLDPKAARKVIETLVENPGFLGSLRPSRPPRSEPDSKLDLSKREHQILSLIAQGKNNTEIAETLHVSYHTVKADVTQILLKLDVQDRTQAAVKALTEKLV